MRQDRATRRIALAAAMAAALPWAAWGAGAPSLPAQAPLAVASPAALVGAPPVYRQIRDWLLVCDNALRCEASAMVEDADHTVRVMREAGPDTPITLRLEAVGALDASLLRVDDNPTLLQSMPWTAGPDRNQYSDLSLQGQDARRALGELLDAQALDLGETADDPVVSLMGLTAVLLAMDDVQGRLDTPGALVRTGPLSERRVRAALPLPVVPPRATPEHAMPAALAAAVRQAQATLLSDACDAGLAHAKDSVQALDATHALVLLECQRGAYQSQFVGFVAPADTPGAAVALALPAPTGSSVLASAPLLPAAWFESSSGTLTVTGKGRGLADCGYLGQWRFDGQRFALATYLEQQTCTGLPYAWPAWYRSRSQPDQGAAPVSSSPRASNAPRAAMGSAAARAAAASIAW